VAAKTLLSLDISVPFPSFQLAFLNSPGFVLALMLSVSYEEYRVRRAGNGCDEVLLIMLVRGSLTFLIFITLSTD
jgi:hypothetical protein